MRSSHCQTWAGGLPSFITFSMMRGPRSTYLLGNRSLHSSGCSIRWSSVEMSCMWSCSGMIPPSPALGAERYGSVGVACSGFGLAGQARGQDQLFVQLEPHRVIRVGDGLGEPAVVARPDLGERVGQLARVAGQARDL